MKNYKYILTHSSGNLTVEYNPIDWAELNIVFKRSDDYHSVLRSQAIDVEFPFDGKAYIDSIYTSYGIDTDIGCEIQYLNKQTKTYSTLYEGIIDLSEWVSTRDTTTVSIIDSSVMAKFIARDEIDIPINRTTDLDENSLSSYTYLNTFTVEGVDLEELAKFDFSANRIQVFSSEVTNFNYYHGVADPPATWIINEIGDDAVIPAEDQSSAEGVIYTNNTGDTVTLRYRVITRIVGSVEVTSTSGQPWSWAAEAWFGPGIISKVIDIDDSGSGSKTTNFDTTYDSGIVTNTIADGETLELYHVWEGSFNGVGDTIDPSFEFQPTYIELYEVIPAADATTPDLPLLHELGAKLLEIMTGESDPLNAPLIGRTDSEPRTYASDGDYSLTGVASGFMLRGFPFADQPLSVSFADYFKSLDALYNLGCWYDGDEFIISAKADYYGTNKIITLGEVQGLEISIATDEYFNSVGAGYEESLSYEEVNGAQNFNVQADFTNDGYKIEAALDLRSPFRADDYGIELSRQNPYSSQAAEDTRYDNAVFIITGQRDGSDYITLQGYDDFTDIEGVYSPGKRLNLNITPKRNLLRHLNRLSIPGFIVGKDLSFLSSEFNLDLSTTKSGESAVTELSDIDSSDMEEPLFYPEIYNFTAPLTNANIIQLQSDPHGYVEFDYLGVTYQGYILEVSSQPFMRQGNWTLIKCNPNRL